MNHQSAADEPRHVADARVATPRSPEPRVVSVGTKLAGATVALMLVATAVVYDTLSAYQRENLLHAREMAATAVTRLFADSCAAPIVFGDSGAIRDGLTHLGRGDDVPYAAVWSSDDSGRSGLLAELGTGAHVEATTVPAALELRREAERLVLLAPVRDLDGKSVGLAAVTFSLARENLLIAQVQRSTLFASAAIAAGLTLLLMLIARFAIVRPLGKLVVAANAIERGLSSDIDVHSKDEIGQLAAAFRSMSGAIASREERINARNRDMRRMLDNVGQGFLTLDANARLSEERSRVVHEWFGVPGPGEAFWEYIGRVDAKAGERFEIGWMLVSDRVMPVEFCLDQLPKRIHTDKRTFELAYRPLSDAGPDQLLVIITDVSARIERERAMVAQRETMSIFQHILSDRGAFDEFFEEAAGMVRTLETSDGSDMVSVRRTLHTLKGSAGIYGIESIADYCHVLETELEEPERIIARDQQRELSARWARMRQVVEQFSVNPGISVTQEEYRGLLSALESHAPVELVARLAAWQFEPAAQRLALIGKQTQTLAERLGKGSLRVEVEPTELRLPPKKWAPLWAVLGHVLRNAVDHGIEGPEERLLSGKPAPTLTLALRRATDDLVLTVADDGRGVDWTAIAERGRALGLAVATAEELETALFEEGVSTRAEVTQTSGRGVGLAAVRDGVRRLGGRLELGSVPGRGTTVRIYLPTTMLADASGDSEPVALGRRLSEQRSDRSVRSG